MGERGRSEDYIQVISTDFCQDFCLFLILDVGVERECAVLQEFLISVVLWGYFECIHFSEIIMV